MRYRKVILSTLAVFTAAVLSAAAWTLAPSFFPMPASEATPTLRVVIDAGGHAVIAPVFPGREEGSSRYRWDRPYLAADGVVSARLLWVGSAGWPEVAYFPIPLAVEWSGAMPGPSPTPTPVPPPIPPPTPEPEPEPEPVAPLWGALIIEETGQRTPEQAATLLSRELALYFVTTKLAYRIEDQDAEGPDGTTPADLVPYIELAKKAGNLPRVFILSTDGTIVFQGYLPATSSAFVALMRQYTKGGKK